MKRMIKPISQPQDLTVSVEVTHVASTDIYSTEVLPISVGNEIDQQALANYNAFLETLWGMIDYYGFRLLRSKDSKSFPYTSKYTWLAYAEDVDADNIPLMIKLRVSDHVQNFSKNHRKELQELNRAEAEELKRPSTKRKQRFVVKNIVVNGEQFATYEEALNAIDKEIRSWLTRLQIDLDGLDPFEL